MKRAQLTDVEREFIGPYLPIGEYGPYRVRLRQQFRGGDVAVSDGRAVAGNTRRVSAPSN
ncbi:hypothetical protein [Streptomyces sp. NPDC055105]|uniref:hypothetical protein n=1 Tax=Streptomyces sp. NPDC055105 TaxID=3365719 RepID=UPI0037D60DFA